MSNEQGPDDQAPGAAGRVAQLEQEIAELTARLPRHSTPPAMLLRLEELEDELQALHEPGSAALHEPEGG